MRLFSIVQNQFIEFPVGSTNFRLGSDPEKLFPYAMFQRHLQRHARVCLIYAHMLVSKICSLDQKNWDEIAENYMHNQEIPNSFFHQNDTSLKEINKRLRDIVIDMIRLGYI